MKYTRLLAIITALCLLLGGCGGTEASVETEYDTVVASTYPVYYLARRVLEGADNVLVEALITEEVSCLHDYTITTAQMRLMEEAELILLSGAGLEHFMESALAHVPEEKLVDSSAGVTLIGDDPHIWMDPERYAQQGDNIAAALSTKYPEYAERINENAKILHAELLEMKVAKKTELLSKLDNTDIITFHDGFTYFADAFGLTILAAVESEEGAEPSAAEIKRICDLIEEHKLDVVYHEAFSPLDTMAVVMEESVARGRPLRHTELSMIMTPSEHGYIEEMKKNIERMIILEDNK